MGVVINKIRVKYKAWKVRRNMKRFDNLNNKLLSKYL